MYEAARKDDQLAHSNWGWALLGGIVAGIVVGAAVVATGGVALVAIAAAGFAGGAVSGAVGSYHSFDGPIKTGAAHVFIGGPAAARAVKDKVGCHMPDVIAQGSQTVAIEDFPAARMEDATQCGGKIGQGCSNVFIGKDPATYVKIKNEVPWGVRFVLGFMMMMGGIKATKAQFNNPKGYFSGLLSRRPSIFSKQPCKNQICRSDPVDVATGHVVRQATDFSLPGRIPLTWRRTYSSQQAQEETSIGIGGWALDWEQWISEEEDLWLLRTEEGRDIYFEKVGIGSTTFHRRERLTLSVGEDGQFSVYDHASRLTRNFSAIVVGGRSLLRTIADHHENSISFYYDGEQLASINDTSGRTIELIRDSSGRVCRMHVRVDDNVVQWVDYAYHLSGELASATDALGHIETYVYDNRHRMLGTKLKNGTGFYYEYDKETDRCVKAWGDGGLHAVELIYDLSLGRTEVRGSAEPRVYLWDDFGLVRREETLDGQSLRVVDVDDDGFVVAEGMTEDQLVCHEYDSLGNRIKTIDPAGNVIAWEYEGNKPILRIDPDGLETHYVHDMRGALTQLTYPTGVCYSLDYDLHGRLIGVRSGDQTVAQFAYDRSHNLVREVDARGASTDFEYDQLGRPTRRKDALGRTTTIEYDALGQPVAIHSPDGSVSRTEYDALGNRTRITDALGQVSELEYSGTGVLSRLVQEDGTIWSLHYDRDERLTRILNPASELYEFIYDDAGRIVSERTFDDRTLRYFYNDAGRVSTMMLPGALVRSFQYDPLGNLISDRAGDNVIAFERDKRGRLAKATLSERSGRVVTEFRRDAFGRIVEELQNGKVVRFSYDERGRRAERALPDGSVTRYGYDEADAISSLEHNGQRFEFERDEIGRETARRAVEGNVAIQSAYDEMDRLVERHVAGGAALAQLSKRTWKYDALGRVHEIADARWGTTVYHYDRIGQLIEAHRGTHREVFQYDTTGSLRNILNELTGSANGRIWDTETGNLLVRTDKARYEYDARGCRTKKVALVDTADERAGSVTQYQWDERDRLREVKKADGTRVLFTYDAFGRRVRKDVLPAGEGGAPRSVEFIWDADELASDNDTVRGARVFVHEPGTFIPLLQAERGEVFAVVNDHLGMPKELVDREGRIAWSAAHSAWGRVVEEHRDAARRGQSVASPFRLLGQYVDDETGLCYTRFRYFDAETGRWCSPDPLGIVGGNNLSSFDGAPNSVVDPLGLACSEWTPKEPLWSKGKLREHFDKHGAEVGASNKPEYSRMASDFGSAPNTGQFKDMKNGAFFYRYEPATKRVFVGTTAGGKIKTFYKWDGRANDPVITALKGAGIL